jgi:serine/threonine-protein kinase
VVGWSVPELPTLVAGDQVAKGTVVRITLSLGPAPRAVPSLVGLTIEEAESALTDIGLSLTTSSEVFSADVAAGKIAVQQPAASAEVERGAVITVALSKGPELAPLPALIGMTIDQARVTLANAGFVEGPISGDPAGTVAAVSIDGKEVAAGAQVPKGSTVSLRFAPPATTTAPGASTTIGATSTSTG